MQHSEIIDAGNYQVYLGNNALGVMDNFLHLPRYSKSRFFILADENTSQHCLGPFTSQVPILQDAEVICIGAGERYKNIESCTMIWQQLIASQADRHAVLINLGGGVVTDVGGFAAATFKRGIRFFNVPTSLIGQIDASIGGKVGVDFNQLKNQIGLFTNPQAVFINPGFLDTLPEEHMLSGFAEIIKHGLIMDPPYWSQVKNMAFSDIHDWIELIVRSAEIKVSIVRRDPVERKYRKVLNFGHTVGHAIESYFLDNDEVNMSHGWAVAIGIICESYISGQKLGFPEESLKEITSYILNSFPYMEITDDDVDNIIRYVKYDKKNIEGELMLSLLQYIGHARINNNCDPALIRESLGYYQSLNKHAGS